MINLLATPVASIATFGAASMVGVVTSTNAAQTLVTGSLTIASHYHKITALIDQNGTGNVRLRCTGGTTTTIQPLRGSYFKVRRLPGVNTTSGNTGTFAA